VAAIPEKPSIDGLEAKWDAAWHDGATYRFDRTAPRENVYSIDTPPPTISGSLHLGTAFGYLQVDAIARYRRMRGHAVYYPMGWDDNGLPTERRVQSHFGVRCEPTLPYDPDLTVEPVTGRGSRERRAVSRGNFVELCEQLTAEFEDDFEQQWRRMGLSVDWGLTYATIDEHCRRVAQRAFLRNLARGEAYASAAPTMWDVDFQTAVAQAELEDRPMPSAYHRIRFAEADGEGHLDIETTRPELLPACVALVVHPDDERYAGLVGRSFRTPVFGVSVPVVAHRLAEPTKGSGAAMICTFGDTTDIVWWRELDLPTRPVVGRDGRLSAEVPSWLEGAGAQAWADLAGLNVKQARRKVVEQLGAAGALLGEPREIVHDVKFFEKGDRPLEIVTSRQWYIRNGARDVELRDRLIARGQELEWHPDFMRRRYEHWVDGLTTDWLISRQRYFGVPFPVWYPLTDDGEVDYERPILADEAVLPVDPQNDVPPGYEAAHRGRPGGFVGDPDVMDTWATSSLTPQIVSGWAEDDDLHARVFPMDLRPQGPEIIRTWLFSSVLRAQLEHDVLPWRHTTINGWILDPDRKKMSKSKDNVLTPMPLVSEYGADALRYWCCKSAPGTDTAVDRAQMKIGRRLAIKLLNASRFVLQSAADEVLKAPDVRHVVADMDRAMLARLAEVVTDSTAAFERYEYHRVLERTEAFFWQFCDDHIELVKQRAFGDDEGARSAQTGLVLALSALLRLFAPFLPFVTEEVWSWWRSGSVHRASWPDAAELDVAATGADPDVLDAIGAVLVEVRRAKTTERRSQRSVVERLLIADTAEQLGRIRAGATDLRNASSVVDLVLEEAAERRIVVELAPVAEEATARS
jgi:valyl-tRNA synthetase